MATEIQQVPIAVKFERRRKDDELPPLTDNTNVANKNKVKNYNKKTEKLPKIGKDEDKTKKMGTLRRNKDTDIDSDSQFTDIDNDGDGDSDIFNANFDDSVEDKRTNSKNGKPGSSDSYKMRKMIRNSFNTEHEFLEAEIYRLRKLLRRFRKKRLNLVHKEEDADNLLNPNPIRENYLIEYTKNLCTGFEKNSKAFSKIKVVESEILKIPKAEKDDDQPYLDYLKKQIIIKREFEKKILPVQNDLKDLYYDHLSKVCCNFLPAHELRRANISFINETKEEELNKEGFADDELFIDPNFNEYEYTNGNVINDYQKLIKEFNQNVSLDLKDLNKLILRLDIFNEKFYLFVQTRINYFNTCERIISKCEVILKVYRDWANEDKNYVDLLARCLDNMNRELKAKESKKHYVESRLDMLQRKLAKQGKDVVNLQYKETHYKRYFDELIKRDQSLNQECDKLLFKISQINMEIKEFDDLWNNPFSVAQTGLHRHTDDKEKKLHINLHRLTNCLDQRKVEQKKLRRTMKNMSNSIKELEAELKTKETYAEPTNDEYEKYRHSMKEVEREIVDYLDEMRYVQRARELKLSMKSYLNLQAGLAPFHEQ